MAQLQGLDEYLAENYEASVFDAAVVSGKPWKFHLHGHRLLTGMVLENKKWDIVLDSGREEPEEVSKIQINYLYPAEMGEAVQPLIKVDKKVEAMNLEAIISPGKRHFVKNKSLFPLMKEREVLLFTMLDGDVLRGIATSFSRYDITLSMKGGVQTILLRHGICDLRNKKNKSFLKSVQQRHRDWEKSALYVAS